MKKTFSQSPPTVGPPNTRSDARPDASNGSPVAKDHKGWATWWGTQAVRSINDAINHTSLDAYGEVTVGLNIDHAVRSARLAWWHVCRAKNYPYWDVTKRDELCR